MAREKEPRTSKDNVLNPASRMSKADYGKLRPRRIEPGIVGRTRWFTDRAGYRKDALSVRRLFAALASAERMADIPAPLEGLLADAHALLKKSGLRRSKIEQPILVDGRGRAIEVKRAAVDKDQGLTAIGEAVSVPEPEGGRGLLVIPVPSKVSSYLDLSEVVGADYADPRNPRISGVFSYEPDDGVVLGRVDGGGVFQVFAYPKDAWVRLTYETLCRYWKWIAIDPVVRKLSKASADRPRLIDRICQLILCPPDYLGVPDPRLFDRSGVGLPPGSDFGGARPDGALPPGNRPGGNVCDRCLGDFLGDLDIFDDVVIPPPLVKWHWIKRPRCSKWKSIGPVPGAGFGGIGRVTQIAIHPSDGDTLIAAAAGGGVWRTDNGGATWRSLMELQPTLTLGAVAIAPSNPLVMYAASGEDADGYGPAWGGIGVYRSSDGGKHWTIAASVPSTLFSAIVVHPTDPNIVYVAGDTGLHKSTDGGASWLANPGLGSLLAGQVTDVVLAHDEPDRLYVGVRADGVYESTNGGIQTGATPAFTRLDGGSQLPASSAAGWIKLAIGRAGAHGSNCVVAKMGNDGGRIFRTLDGGAAWTELASGVATVSFDEWCSVIAVDPADEDVMYAGAAGALQRTTNGGATAADWTSIYSGIHADQQDIVFDPTQPSRIFLANDGGVYRSLDRGDNWELASGKLAITQMYDIDIAERDRDIVGGGAQDNGVYYRDGSGVWHHIPWGDGTQFAIDQTDPRIFYFSAQNGLPVWIRKSTDGGQSHQQIGQTGLSGGSPWITVIKLDPTDPISNPATNRTLFVCGHNELFRSTDGGQNWQRVEDSAGVPFQTTGTITALEFARANTSVLYLGTSTGALYRGINGGASAADWSRLDLVGTSGDALFPNAQIQSLSINPADENDVWVVFGGAGVDFTSRPNMILNPLGISHLFRSRDGGVNWTDASGRFAPANLPDVPTSAVAIADFDREVAYVGTDVGAFRTVDGGQTWTAFQDGLPRSPVTELKFNRRHNRLFAATMGRGVFVRDV